MKHVNDMPARDAITRAISLVGTRRIVEILNELDPGCVSVCPSCGTTADIFGYCPDCKMEQENA